MTKHFKFLVLAAIVFTPILLVPVLARSSPLGVTVAPVKFRYELDPGKSISDFITVANPNDSNLKVQAEFQDFKVTEGNDIQWLPSDIENPYKMSDWITIRRDVVILKPNEEIRIPFKINVPRNATAGGHYAAIFFRGMAGGAEEGNLGAVPRVGALVILNVKGDLKRQGEFISFSSPWFVNSGPVKFSATILNNGTTHFETKADITVKNLFWKSGSFSSETKIIYPGIKRELKAVWPKKFLLGIYIAKATVLDGDGNLLQKTKVFIGFPYIYLIILAIALIILWYARIWFRKRFKLVRVN